MNSSHFIRAVSLALTTLLACTALITPAAAETVTAEAAAVAASAPALDTALITDGHYHIVNVATGQYLDTHDLIYDWQGSAYLDRATGQSGQDIRITRRNDGNYTLTPLSDGAKYNLSAAAGTYITKKAATDLTEAFNLIPVGDGNYAISPASRTDGAVVTIGQSKTRYNYNRAVLAEFTAAENQLWMIERIKPTALTLAYTELRERLYTVGTYYATLAPFGGAEQLTWSSDNEAVLMINQSGEWVALGEGKATVTVRCGDLSDSMTVTVIDSPAYSFYSQHQINGTNWNGGALAGIRFTAGGVTKRYATDKYNRNTDWMDQGCALSCHAMALRNLGATLTDGYDFRSGQDGNLPADPYTVSLANTGNTGAVTANDTLFGNPIYVNHNLIATRFNVDGQSLTCTQYYVPNARAIKEQLDKHPEGVIVGMENGSYGSHYFLFTKCLNPEEKNPANYRFEVCDPAAYGTNQKGDHVPFEQCYSYVSLGYRMWNITCMLTYNIQPAAPANP